MAIVVGYEEEECKGKGIDKEEEEHVLQGIHCPYPIHPMRKIVR